MQAFRFVVVAMLLLLQKPIKVAAAESSDNCETLAIYNHPKRCNGEPKFEYHLSVSCVNETTVSVWFQEPAGNYDGLELVTMQYTCYNATDDEELTHAFTYESEILSEQYNQTNQLFSKGTCLFTGCAKKNRLPCWLYITEAVNVSCAGQNDPFTSPTFTPSSVFNTITVSPTAISFSSNTNNLQPSVITRPDVSQQSNSPFLPLPNSLDATSLFRSPVPSIMTVNNNNNVPSHIMRSKKDPAPNKPTNYDIVTITASVAVIVVSSVSLIALLLSFLACRRLYRKTKMSSSFYAKDTEGPEEENIYVDKFGKLEDNDNAVKGSILTLVQPLNYKHFSNNYNKAIDHHPIVSHKDNTMLLKGEQLIPCDNKVHSSLSNSCHSLPERTGTMSQHREQTQYLSQANCYLTFYDARVISESSCEDSCSSCTSSLQDSNDVFTKDTRREESRELKQHSFVVQSQMKHLSTSSGYLSTSPHDDEQGFGKMDGKQYGMDQDYIYDMLPSV